MPIEQSQSQKVTYYMIQIVIVYNLCTFLMLRSSETRETQSKSREKNRGERQSVESPEHTLLLSLQFPVVRGHGVLPPKKLQERHQRSLMADHHEKV